MKSPRQRKTREVAEFGDFQTPLGLALQVAALVKRLGISPKSILEPSCGKGAFVDAAAATFPDANRIVGVDINRDHLDIARELLKRDKRIEIGTADFFTIDWRKFLDSHEAPHLIIGNPPWVTSAELGSLSSRNLPAKSNFHGRTGIDAITGKSNFDISEWMLLRYLDCLEKHAGAFAVLCKTAVARKVLLSAWTRDFPISSARIYMIDALEHFGAAVEACLFVVESGGGKEKTASCEVFASIDAPRPTRTIAFRDHLLIADEAAYEAQRHLLGPETNYTWRSGLKHDCSKVMELRMDGNGLVNGLDEQVRIEDAYLYPLLKSSDVGNGRLEPRYKVVVTQKAVGEDTSSIERLAPQTWRYLVEHAEHLDRRGSSIYKKKPRFSIFGVGPYAFAPWKIAISGFYKSLRFSAIGNSDGRPTILDDTISFLPCWSEQEADFLLDLLGSAQATAFLESMIWWSDKRPITADLLKRLSLERLAREMGRDRDYDRFAVGHSKSPLFRFDRNAA